MSYENPNVITLGSLQFIIDGQVVAQPASSWGEGIRQGSPDYADIDHAFFKAYEDFRGGMGVKYGKAREHIDVMKESFGVRTWDSGLGLELAPLNTQVTIGAIVPSYFFRNFALREHTVGGTNYLWLGAGSSVLRWDSGSAAWSKDSPSTEPSANTTHAMYEWTNTEGSRHLYWGCGFVNTSTLARTDAPVHRRDPGIAVGSGAAWESGEAGEFAHDFIDFRKQLLKIHFGEVKVSDTGASGSWTDVNINIPGPNLTFKRSKFVGLALANNGELHPYVLRSGKLYWLDIPTQDYGEVETGMNFVIDAIVYQDEIAATDNNSVKLIHPNRPIRDIGLPSFKDGFITDTGDYSPAFLKLHTWGPYLIAFVNMDDGNALAHHQLWLYNGSGWHGMDEVHEGSVINTVNGGEVIGFYSGSNLATPGQELWTVFADSNGSTLKTNRIETAGGIQHDRLNLKVEPSGQIITPWFDGGFADMGGTIIELTLASQDLLAGNETIQVEYQIDYNESTWLTTNLEDSGLFTGSPQQTKKFGATAGQGIAIKTSVRFRITLSRGSTVTDTPILLSLILKYTKTPKLRARYNFTVDVARTADFRRPTTGEVTYESIIDELWGFLDDDPLTPFSYVGETTKWTKMLTAPRRDILAPKHDDKYSRIVVDLIEPVGA